MRIRTSFILILVVELASFSALAALSLWTFDRLARINQSVDQGVRLIARSRRVHSLLKDVVFELFTPRSYEYLRESVLSPRSLVTGREWIEETRIFRAEYETFMRDPDVRLLLGDEELKVAYEIAVPLSSKAFSAFDELGELAARLRETYGSSPDLYAEIQASKDESAYAVFGQVKDASFFLTNVFEGYLNRFVLGFQREARRMQSRTIIAFVFIILILGIVTVTAVYLLTSRILGTIRILERAIAQVSAGDFSVNLPARGSDELSKLATAFGTLASDVKRAVESIPTLLKDVNEVIPEEPDLHRILGLLTEAFLREGGAESASVFLFETADPAPGLKSGSLGAFGRLAASGGNESLLLASVSGFEPIPGWKTGECKPLHSVALFSHAPAGEDPAQRLRTGAFVVKDVENASFDPRSSGLASGIRGLVLVPLVVRRRLSGYCLFLTASSALTDLTVYRLSASADHAAQVVDNVMAYAALSARRDAEYEALQSQIRPHFLSNVLTGLAALNRMGEKGKLEVSLFALKDMLRYTLDRRRWSTVHEEFEFLERYCQLQKLRFEDRFGILFEADADCLRRRIPKLILQPVLENAFIHGLEPKAGPGHILVRARSCNRDGSGEPWLELLVRDDGIGCDVGKIASRERVGLSNVGQRLAILYPGASLTMESSPGEGFTVLVRIPLGEEETE